MPRRDPHDERWWATLTRYTFSSLRTTASKTRLASLDCIDSGSHCARRTSRSPAGGAYAMFTQALALA